MSRQRQQAQATMNKIAACVFLFYRININAVNFAEFVARIRGFYYAENAQERYL